MLSDQTECSWDRESRNDCPQRSGDISVVLKCSCGNSPEVTARKDHNDSEVEQSWLVLVS